MIVYRIAKADTWHAYPVGPYQWTDRKGGHPQPIAAMADAHRDSTHPIPSLEGYWMNADDLCGFTDELRLMEWFDGFLDMLHDLGFEIYEYDCPYWAMHDLKYQSVFSLTHSYLVRQYPILARERREHIHHDPRKDWRNMPVWAVLMLDANSHNWRDDFSSWEASSFRCQGEGYMYVNMQGGGYYVVDQYNADTTFYGGW